MSIDVMASLKDIAETAGCSVSTVSRVLTKQEGDRTRHQKKDSCHRGPVRISRQPAHLWHTDRTDPDDRTGL